jgi:hypothetical protein
MEHNPWQRYCVYTYMWKIFVQPGAALERADDYELHEKAIELIMH